MPRDASVTEGRFLAFCEDYARAHGRAPTVRELMDGVGVQNPTGASRALRKHVQTTYEKAFAGAPPQGLDQQLLQRLQELQDAAAELGLAEVARERVDLDALQQARNQAIADAVAERDTALKLVEATRQERALFEARTTEEIAAKAGQIVALTQDLAHAQQRHEDDQRALSRLTAAMAESQALLRQATATAAQQQLAADERQEAALLLLAGTHQAEKRKLAADLAAADRERRRAEDNLVIVNTKFALTEKALEQSRQQVQTAQAQVTARAVAEQAAKDAQARAERAETEATELRSDGRRQAEALARLEAENAVLRKLVDSQHEKRPGRG